MSQFENETNKTDNDSYQRCSTDSLENTGEFVSDKRIDKKLICKSSK